MSRCLGPHVNKRRPARAAPAERLRPYRARPSRDPAPPRADLPAPVRPPRRPLRRHAIPCRPRRPESPGRRRRRRRRRPCRGAPRFMDGGQGPVALGRAPAGPRTALQGGHSGRSLRVRGAGGGGGGGNLVCPRPRRVGGRAAPALAAAGHCGLQGGPAKAVTSEQATGGGGARADPAFCALPLPPPVRPRGGSMSILPYSLRQCREPVGMAPGGAGPRLPPGGRTSGPGQTWIKT